ncbi:LysM domain receptor-like kinase 3 isoform X2, partial [Tanacetum coccineum]
MVDGTLMTIHMFVDKRYPLTKETLEKMLNWRLEVDHESTLAYELLKFIREITSLGEDCWELNVYILSIVNTEQWDDLSSIMNSVVLSSSKDRWTCDLSGDGEFKVKVIRNFIDDLFLPSSDVATRWVKFIPIKVNVFSWRARRDRLPTRVNLSRRCVLLDSHLCPLCNAAMEDVQHVFFRCDVARVVLRKICRWWDLDWQEICSFSDWDAWFLSFPSFLPSLSYFEVSIVQSRCNKGCDLAYGSYYVEPGNDFTRIANYANTDIPTVLRYNPSIPNQDTLPSFVRINFPFSCDCISGEFLGHVFSYDVQSQDTYAVIANRRYANLTTADWIQRFNNLDPNRIPDTATINVTVNCSCGDKDISKEYGLFSTYPLRSGENLNTVSSAANLSSDLIRRYNPNANFSAGSLVYIPARDEHGNYPPIKSSKGISGAAIGGIVVGVVAFVLLVAGC